jgi:hypothetical protein
VGPDIGSHVWDVWYYLNCSRGVAVNANVSVWLSSRFGIYGEVRIKLLNGEVVWENGQVWGVIYDFGRFLFLCAKKGDDCQVRQYTWQLDSECSVVHP